MATKRAPGSGVRRRKGGGKGGRGVYFLSLTLENVRCFGPAQTLDLSDGQGRPRQWTVILGNNGVGKTTLLQALTGSLPTEEKSQDRDTVEFFPLLSMRFSFWQLNLLRSELTSARIDGVFAQGGRLTDPVRGHRNLSMHLEFTRRKGAFTGVEMSGPADLCFFAYGAARRMGLGSLSDPGAGDPIATLFRDDLPLRNAEEWLLQTDYAANKPSPQQERARTRRDAIRRMLIDLLPDVEDIQILADIGDNPARPRPGIRLKTPYGWVPLQGLSLGYKTLLAWMVDLASRLYERYPDSENPLAEPAVVLVDEIDLHLHPTWQRDLIRYLTERFPNVQFIVTAHSPLVVQAATDANVVVLRREDDHVVIDNSGAAVRNWRVDQILTSDLFGLPSARPPALDALLAERRRLLTKPRLSAADRRALERVEQKLGELPAGETPEQMEAMDIIQRAARSLKKAGGGKASSG